MQYEQQIKEIVAILPFDAHEASSWCQVAKQRRWTDQQAAACSNWPWGLQFVVYLMKVSDGVEK